MGPDGSFVIAWQESTNFFAQHYTAAGKTVSGGVAIGSGGGNRTCLLWRWTRRGTSRSPGIKARISRAAPSSQRHATWQQLSLVSTEPKAAIAMQGTGDFAVSWRQGEEVVAQRFTATALPKDAAAFVVDTSLAGDQNDPAVAIDSQGNLLVVWSGVGVTDNTGIFSQRYADPPAALRADEVGHNAAATLLTLAQTRPLLAEPTPAGRRSGSTRHY